MADELTSEEMAAAKDLLEKMPALRGQLKNSLNAGEKAFPIIFGGPASERPEYVSAIKSDLEALHIEVKTGGDSLPSYNIPVSELKKLSEELAQYDRQRAA